MTKRNYVLSFYILWLFVLVFIPLLVMIFLAFTNTNGLDFSNFSFTLNNFKRAIDPIYIEAYVNSIKYSAITSTICLLIAYPIAYVLSKSSTKVQSILFIVFLLPMWSNMLLRIRGWEIFFRPNSLLSSFGINVDLIGHPSAIIIGMISMYLPLMIFPIYTSLNKMDKSLLEASKDLGASSYQTFIKVVLPLTLPGIYSGITMTFLPSATNFALPERLSGGRTILIGNIINTNFGKTFDYNLGSLLSVVLITIIFISMLYINNKDKDGDLIL